MTTEQTLQCRCCGSKVQLFDRARILGKYPIDYHRCTACGFIQTDTPFWLAECYENPMPSYDLGGISRPTLNSELTKAVLNTCFDPSGRFLDFGGGYGVFTRWMRDAGYNFWHHDKHCANLFANGFDADVSEKAHYELVTAFEVFEHLPDPVQTLEFIFRFTDSVLFTTELVPNTASRVSEWWYFGPEHGQHVAFYTPAALRKLGERFKAHHLEGREGFHLLTRREVNPERFRLVLGRRARHVINFFHRRQSLLPMDFQTAMMRAKQPVQTEITTG